MWSNPAVPLAGVLVSSYTTTMPLSQLTSGFAKGKSPWWLLGLPFTLSLECRHHSAQSQGQRKTQVEST